MLEYHNGFPNKNLQVFILFVKATGLKLRFVPFTKNKPAVTLKQHNPRETTITRIFNSA